MPLRFVPPDFDHRVRWTVSLSGHQLFRLSWADLLDEWPTSVALVLAIAAVLAPLLVLNGLRTGVIGEIFERLRTDSTMRRVTLEATGANRFDDQWFRLIGERSDVAFILPSTRFAAGQVHITAVSGASVQPLRVSLAPTGPGDPVFGHDSPPLEANTAVKLSAAVAVKTGLRLGDRLHLDVERRRADGRIEPANIEVMVAEIAPPERHGTLIVFIRPALLLAVEAFRGRLRSAGTRICFRAGKGGSRRLSEFPALCQADRGCSGPRRLSVGRAGSEREDASRADCLRRQVEPQR